MTTTTTTATADDEARDAGADDGIGATTDALLIDRITRLLPIMLRRRRALTAANGTDTRDSLALWLRSRAEAVIRAGDVRLWASDEYEDEEAEAAHEAAALAATAVLYLSAAKRERQEVRVR